MRNIPSVDFFEQHAWESEINTVTIAIGTYNDDNSKERIYACFKHSIFNTLNEDILIPESTEFNTPNPKG